MCSNSKAIVGTLAATVDKAHTMFRHGAYVHQYAQHGVDQLLFDASFLQVDQIVHNYTTLR